MNHSIQRNIFLIGPMASGKTTVGILLAKQLGCHFLDTDRMICAHFGMTVAEIFASKGEHPFRLRETEILSECADMPGVVVATGGGAVTQEASRKVIANSSTRSHNEKSGCAVIYLKTSIATQLKRLEGHNDRPLVAGRNKEEVLHRLAQERNHHYDELADLVLLTDHKSPAMLAQEAADFLKAQDDPQACTKPEAEKP